MTDSNRDLSAARAFHAAATSYVSFRDQDGQPQYGMGTPPNLEPEIWLKRRRAEMARIDEFEVAMGGGELRAGRDAGNTIRSFFIHNGVALTAIPLR